MRGNKLVLDVESYISDEEVISDGITVFDYIIKELKSVGFEIDEIDEIDFEKYFEIDPRLVALQIIQSLFIDTDASNTDGNALFQFNNN